MVIQGGSILAIDYGEARVGLAVASKAARLAHPIGALQNDDSLLQKLQVLCEQEKVSRVVIGLPRGMNGQDTPQTAVARGFGDRVSSELKIPISWQDEAVTSAQAKDELEERGKPYGKEDVDALAATYILEDYLNGTL